MKYIKHIILTAMAVVVMTGAWAQTEIDPDPYTPTQQTDGSWMFTMPAANKLLEVENYNTYTLTLASNDNTMGTVELLNSYTLTFTGVNSTAEPIVIPYYDGDSITLDRTCSQMAQYFFPGHSYITVSTPTNISCEQQGLTVKEVFTDTKELKFGNKTIQVTCTPNMSNVIETGDNEYTVIDGAVVTVKATPANNYYHFVNWTDENSNVMGTDAQLTFTVTGDTAVTGNFAGQESRLDSVRTTWDIYINDASTAVHPIPYSPNDTLGYVLIPAGAIVMITPSPAEATKVKDLEMFQMLPRRINLDTVQHHLVAQNGDTLTGTLDANNHPVKISIANGATVTLDGVTINGTNNESYKWAGITCLGNVTIILKNGTTNTVKGFYNEYPGVFVYDGYTLTIKGGGKLIASSNGHGAGIGGGYNISCGNIDIQGGIIEATGGYHAAGIGGGHIRNCGTITITDGVTRVTATKGAEAPNSIGIGFRDTENTCGTVTIGGTVYWQNNAYVGDGETYLKQSTIVYPAP